MNQLNELIIFEMANNHQGSVEHGLRIIEEMGKLVKKHNLNASVKLQYRHLDTFIHPVKRKDRSIKYVERFLSTELKPDQFFQFIKAIKAAGMKTVVTPFDEKSVDLILEHEVDIIKVASCSADDWPLLEKIAAAKKPVIASTGGLLMEPIDSLVSFFTNRVKDFSLLHCVSVYPTPPDMLNISFLKKLINRYPDIKVGYSGHEDPANPLTGQMALAMGAQVFERHVAVPTDTISINAYSMTPEQTDTWLSSLAQAKEILGDGVKKVTDNERKSLLALKRGVFAKDGVKTDQQLTLDNVYYAFPCEEGQLTSSQFGKLRSTYKTSKSYKKDAALFESTDLDTYHKVRGFLHEAKGMLTEAGIVLSDSASIELSHHYGVEKFREFGCLIVNLVNREYCKKIIVVFPGQNHPEQYHVKKEETFHILSGELTLTLNGIPLTLKKGDIKTIERGDRHSFNSENGAIIEEVSTTHHRGDSFYLDPKIAQQDPMARKTLIEYL